MEKLPAKDFLSIVFKDSLKNSKENYETVINILNDYMSGKMLTTALEEHKMSLHKFLYLISEQPSLINLYDDSKQIHNLAFKNKLIKAINDKSSDDWRAAAWILERKWPDEYGKHVTLNNAPIDNDNPQCIKDYINAEFTDITDEDDDSPE